MLFRSIVARVREDAGPRRHAWLKEARPADVVDGTVVLEVPPHLPFHLEQLRADTELHRIVAGITADVLGAGLALAFEHGDGGEDLAPAAAPAVERDSGELLEEGDDATDPTSLVVDILGGEVVSE